MKREKRTETNEGDEREISGEKGIIKYYFFFYSTAKKFAILEFRVF